MQCKGPQLGCLGMPKVARLAPRNAAGDGYVTEVIGDWGLGIGLIGCGVIGAGRERQDVRDAIFSSIRAVQLLDACVADQRNSDGAARAGRGNTLEPGRQAGGPDRTAAIVRNGHAKFRASSRRFRSRTLRRL